MSPTDLDDIIELLEMGQFERAHRDLKALRFREADNELLNKTNSKGFTLHHSLNGMLKKWREEDPRWPVSEGLKRQAQSYGVTLERLHGAISRNLQLSKGFADFPESGFEATKRWHTA